MLLNFVRAYLDSRDEFYGLPKGFVRAPLSDGPRPMRLFLPPISDTTPRRSNFTLHVNRDTLRRRASARYLARCPLDPLALSSLLSSFEITRVATHAASRSERRPSRARIPGQ